MKRLLKKTMMIIMIYFLFQLLTINILASSIIISSEKKVIVDQTGNGDFTSIQKAINIVEPGTSIFIKKGEYQEIIEIKKPVELIGAGKDATLISPISEKNKYAVNLGAPNILLENIGIRNGAPGLYTSAVRITAENTKIKNCNFFDTPIGIAIWTSNNQIENCNFWGCKDEGIALLGSTYSPCNNNQILNCVFYKNCDGIELQHSSFNTISDCEFYENTHTGINAIASNNSKNRIIRCKITENQVHGIYFSGSVKNEIIDCIIEKNQDGNIIMNKFSRDNYISNNEPTIQQKTINVIKRSSIIENIIPELLEKIKEFKNNRISTFLSNYNY